MKTMRGIEPIIAVVILVAVTLVIAIGVIGWIMGWWGTMGATESLQVMPESEIRNGTLTLYVKNTGTATAVVHKIEIVGLTQGVQTLNSVVTISPGGVETITLSNLTAVPGTNYLVKIYTKAGNVYQGVVQAK